MFEYVFKLTQWLKNTFKVHIHLCKFWEIMYSFNVPYYPDVRWYFKVQQIFCQYKERNKDEGYIGYIGLWSLRQNSNRAGNNAPFHNVVMNATKHSAEKNCNLFAVFWIVLWNNTQISLLGISI